MESLTKNKLDKNIIETIIKKFFPTSVMQNCHELKEGYFNAAYEIHLNDGQQLVLKVAPKNNARIMTYEKNIMDSETSAMQMVSGVNDIPSPKLYGVDMSGTICPSPYFLMEKLDGNSLSSVKENLSEREIQDIYFKMGEINKKINEIDCPTFGYPGQTEFQGENWYDIFRSMIEAGIEDAKKGNIDLKVPIKDLLVELEKNRDIFEEVKAPKLVHWDCWDGNIFVKNGKIVGIIDWERCLWADPLMEVGFRTYDTNSYFFKGYGITQLTSNQMRRAIWYDIYLLILMALECEYRKYDSLEMYYQSTELLQKQFRKIIDNEY